MSVNFSANQSGTRDWSNYLRRRVFKGCTQYENAFKTLKNWEIPKGIGKYPCPRDGLTEIIANDRGHLNSGMNRSRASPWGMFVGTWDMPTKLPGHSITNGTARSGHAVDHLDRMKTDGDMVLRGHLKPCKIPVPLSVKADVEATTGFVDVNPKPMSARLDGSPPAAESGLRSGAKNPEPASRCSPKSVEWPQPGASRLEKPLSPKPPSPQTNINMAASPGLDLDVHAMQATTSPVQPVSWHMPQSPRPQMA